MASESAGKPILPAALVLLTVIAVLVAIPIYQEWKFARWAENERAVSAALETLRRAAWEFCHGDRDGNGVEDFWNGDVRGLYDLPHSQTGKPIRLISAELAAADPSHPDARPYHGYWIIAMETDEDGKSLRLDTPGGKNRHPARFGFCAYPAVPGRGGNHRFIINEGNSIFKNWETEPVKQWPAESELRNRWSKPGG